MRCRFDAAEAQRCAVGKKVNDALSYRNKGSIKPFTQDGIDALLAGQTVHPRATLSTAAKVVQYALDKGLTSINAECIKEAGESKPSAAAPDFSEGIEGAV
jgi:hypothetical protein